LNRGSLSGSVILVSGISPAKRRVMKIDLIRRGLGRPSLPRGGGAAVGEPPSALPSGQGGWGMGGKGRWMI